MSVRLVTYSHGAGCACKLGPADLREVLAGLGGSADPSLMVGLDTGDDAAVYKLDDERALVFTTDFFTPIVDDAYDWGRIAATNALSDVYAMGGTPLLCLNITAWPRDALPLDLLARVLAGGADAAREAGALVVGGHTIDDAEPKCGMAVVGTVHPSKVVTNAGAQRGDVLVLTKPIGLGVISTGIKNGVAQPETVKIAIETMTTLNAAASEAMQRTGVHAATDVTGFSLLGHLQRLAAASSVSAVVRASSVPVIDGAQFLAGAGQIPSGSRRNRSFLEPYVRFKAAVDEIDRILLTDAQTSGGLLIACPPRRLGKLQRELSARGSAGAEIGVIGDEEPGTITVTP
ncbi:MAG: selenide, water dikinase SelD [Actinomycetota bacterium]